jgi:hypothetical protein
VQSTTAASVAFIQQQQQPQQHVEKSKAMLNATSAHGHSRSVDVDQKKLIMQQQKQQQQQKINNESSDDSVCGIPKPTPRLDTFCDKFI